LKKFKVESVVFYEAIRNEIGGKHTLLGVSAPEVDVTEMPAVLAVGAWVCIQPSRTGNFDLRFRVLDVDKNEIINGELTGQLTTMAKSSVAMGPFPLHASRAGIFSFEWGEMGGEWEKIGDFKVNFKPPNSGSLPIA
jgi:hypothetical protein